MLLLSESYAELGLMYAAKYYATGVLFTAYYNSDDNIKTLLPRSISKILDYYYASGESMNFIQSIDFGLYIHSQYNENIRDWGKNDDLQICFTHLAILRAITFKYGYNFYCRYYR